MAGVNGLHDVVVDSQQRQCCHLVGHEITRPVGYFLLLEFVSIPLMLLLGNRKCAWHVKPVSATPNNKWWKIVKVATGYMNQLYVENSTYMCIFVTLESWP